MDKYIINGGGRLYGRVNTQSAKNTVLPLLAASVLTDEPVCIKNLPNIRDINVLLQAIEGRTEYTGWLSQYNKENKERITL